jgi:hypothetical protein
MLSTLKYSDQKPVKRLIPINFILNLLDHSRIRLREVAKLTGEDISSPERLSTFADADFIVDDEGKLRLQVDELTQALDGVELNRIRECKLCGQIFWAGRKDKKCCSLRCNNVYNVRNTPRRKLDKAQRMENEIRRERHKKSKLCKS